MFILVLYLHVRNIEESSSNWNKRIWISNMELYECVKSPGKGNLQPESNALILLWWGTEVQINYSLKKC